METDLLKILFDEQPAPAIAVPKPKPVKRAFYRCLDCLSVMAVETALRMEYSTVIGQCGACGGKLDFLGYTCTPTRLSVEVEQSVCDERCTQAVGPHCDCQCGGKNHGSKKTVTVRLDMGPVPVITPIDLDKAKQVASEFREVCEKAKQAFDAKYGSYIDKYNNRIWLNSQDFSLFRESEYKWSFFLKAKSAQVHKVRIKNINQWIERLNQR